MVDDPLNPYELDLNNDGINDFILGVILSSTYWNSYSSYKSAFIRQTRTGSYVNSWVGDVSALSSGDLINSSAGYWASSGSSWNLGSYTISSGKYWGNFPGEGDKFIGLRFHIQNELHYGWVRVNIPYNVDEISIIDWAYQADPDTGLLAGNYTETPPAITLTPVLTELTDE
jgi:hypothetical protein